MGENVEKLECFMLLTGTKNGSIAHGRSVEFPHNLKNRSKSLPKKKKKDSTLCFGVLIRKISESQGLLYSNIHSV